MSRNPDERHPTHSNVLMDGLLVIDKPVGPDLARRRRARAAGARRAARRPHRHARSGGQRRAAAGHRPRDAARAVPERERQELRRRHPARRRDRHLRRAGTRRRRAVRRPAAHRARRSSARSTTFRGTFLQQPPAYSAKRIGGTAQLQAGARARSRGSQHQRTGIRRRRSRHRDPAPAAVLSSPGARHRACDRPAAARRRYRDRCAWTAPPASTCDRWRTIWASGSGPARISRRCGGRGAATSRSATRSRSTRSSAIATAP